MDLFIDEWVFIIDKSLDDVNKDLIMLIGKYFPGFGFNIALKSALTTFPMEDFRSCCLTELFRTLLNGSQHRES